MSLAACLPRHGRYTWSAQRPRAAEPPAALKNLRVWVSDDVLLTGEVTDDEIPGNALRRRWVSKLPAALRDALRRAGFREVTGDKTKPHDLEAHIRARLNLLPEASSDYVGTRYVFDGVTTLYLEHDGTLVEALDVNLPLGDVGPGPDRRRGKRVVDWRSYPDELSRALVEAVGRSGQLATLVRGQPARPLARTPSLEPTRTGAVADAARTSLIADPEMRALLDGGAELAEQGSTSEKLAALHALASKKEADDRAARAAEAAERARLAEARVAEARALEARAAELSLAAVPSVTTVKAEPARPAQAAEATGATGATGATRVAASAAGAIDALEPLEAEGEAEATMAEAIAVFEIEDASHSFPAEMLEQLSEYLATKVTEVLDQPVVPREELRTRLVAEKSKGYRDCADQRCQIALGKALAAKKSLSTKLLRVGGTCAITLALYDLETELAERATSLRTDCDDQALLFAVDRVVERLGHGAEREGGQGADGTAERDATAERGAERASPGEARDATPEAQGPRRAAVEYIDAVNVARPKDRARAAQTDSGVERTTPSPELRGRTVEPGPMVNAARVVSIEEPASRRAPALEPASAEGLPSEPAVLDVARERRARTAPRVAPTSAVDEVVEVLWPTRPLRLGASVLSVHAGLRAPIVALTASTDPRRVDRVLDGVIVELTLAPGLDLVRVAGVGAQLPGPGLAWRIPALASAESRGAAFEVRATCKAPGPLTLGHLVVRYVDWTQGGRPVKHEEELVAECGRTR